VLAGKPDPLKVTNEERNSLTFSSYSLDVHVTPASNALSARVALTAHNDGTAPLSRLVLLLSSSLHWEGIAVAAPGAPLAKLPFKTRLVATDTDHTGWVSEAVIPLPTPLAPGESLPIEVVYSGSIAPSAERLQRIGAPDSQAASADWDAIGQGPDPDNPSVTPVALRGFGNVIWYPVSAPIVFLGDGARLFQVAGVTKLRQQSAQVSLRLSVEFVGDPPDAAFFCGRPQPFKVVHDNPDAPVATGTGVATTTFEAQPLGFRTLTLFVTGHPATATGTTAEPDLIATVTDHFDALKSYPAAAEPAISLLSAWLGKDPLTPLHLLDHAGEPFEDDALLVTPITAHVSAGDKATLSSSLVHSLTHAWFHSEHPWIDEGLAQFMSLLWTEQTAGRGAVLDHLQESAHSLALAEPASAGTTGTTVTTAPLDQAAARSSSSRSGEPASSTEPGQPLVDASSDLFYRTKAAAVWWMLRSYTGDDALKQALQQYRATPALDHTPDGLQRTLERTSHQNLGWFFDDWVYHDRGLPDLSIVNVTPRQLEARNGSGGWLVSVEVRNDGDAIADVPITVRSAGGADNAAAASETQRLRIPAHGSVARRIVFPVAPTEVQVNDGSVPETRVGVHIEHIAPANQ
jgi:hypothetical protein